MTREGITTDRDWFVQNNAVALLQERDELIERQRIEIARLTRAVNSLKAEIRRDTYSLKQRWQQDPACHWCLIKTHLSKNRTPKGGCPDFWATLDHLVSKKNGNGQKGDEVVLACYFCNFQRNNAEQKERELMVDRNGFRLTFQPNGKVRREEQIELGVAEGAQATAEARQGTEQATW